MMRASLSFFRAIEFQPLLISALCHIAVAQMVIFSFSVRPQEFKPSFIFLGAILRENDFRNLQDKENAGAQATSQVINIKAANAFEPKRQIKKPAFSQNSHGQKAFLKSSFVKESDREQEEAKDLGIDVTVPKRVPLKLNLK